MGDFPQVPPGGDQTPPPEVENVPEEEEDTWDNIDEEKLSRQVEELKLTAEKTQPKKPINYFAPPPKSNWDPLGTILYTHSLTFHFSTSPCA